MATRNHENLQPVGFGSELLLIRWAGLLTTDTGDWIAIPQHCDVTVQCFGTFGGAASTVTMQGSNEVVA